MRTFINQIMKNNVIGIGQDRVVVTVRDERRGAAQHLASWHASRLLDQLSLALKRASAIALAHAGQAQACPAYAAGSYRSMRPMRLVAPVVVRS